jgi:cytochrome c553
MFKSRRVAAGAEWLATLAFVLSTCSFVGLPAQSRPETTLPPGAESLAGATSFDLYCASCHGRLGRGDGPAAPALRTAPADLTVLARRNGGAFPRDRVMASMEGRARVAAHGSPDMPVWGPLFRELDALDERETTRLRNLIAFVESIQAPREGVGARGPDPDGATTYRNYCASCHGTTAAGNGPFTFALRTVPPALTTLAQRNGGVFPRERVTGIIEGAGLPAHGAREMPVWGDLFRRGRPIDPSAATRIDGLVRHLESIQQ